MIPSYNRIEISVKGDTSVLVATKGILEKNIISFSSVILKIDCRMFHPILLVCGFSEIIYVYIHINEFFMMQQLFHYYFRLRK